MEDRAVQPFIEVDPESSFRYRLCLFRQCCICQNRHTTKGLVIFFCLFIRSISRDFIETNIVLMHHRHRDISYRQILKIDIFLMWYNKQNYYSYSRYMDLLEPPYFEIRSKGQETFQKRFWIGANASISLQRVCFLQQVQLKIMFDDKSNKCIVHSDTENVGQLYYCGLLYFLTTGLIDAL